MRHWVIELTPRDMVWFGIGLLLGSLAPRMPWPGVAMLSMLWIALWVLMDAVSDWWKGRKLS